MVIRVSHLSKRYRLGEFNRRALFDDVRRWAQACLGGRKDVEGGSAKVGAGERWALRDVTVDIQEGEVVGVIGRNGAGKSTLLKILSKITAPTEGRVEFRGRLASLLEVGTGFHPELTGRENVYLNGTILGMKKREIDGRFDEIVDFSGVEEYLDTPVKRYSSGMRVRLAFAVAAHLDPDILVVDEVLAVGDVAFQSKCLGKIGAAAREGRTVLFVSHNSASVESLCRRGLVLEGGRLVFDGTQTAALRFYTQKLQSPGRDLLEREDRRGTGAVRIRRIGFRDESGQETGVLTCGRPGEIFFEFETDGRTEFQGVNLNVQVMTVLDVLVFSQNNTLGGGVFNILPRRGEFVCRIGKLPLPQGEYRISYDLREKMNFVVLDGCAAAAELSVEAGDFFGHGVLPRGPKAGCYVEAEWDLREC